jgi:hypothetical protein
MACGANIPAGFRTTFLCYTPGNFPGGRFEMWAFVDLEKRVFKTMKKAVEVCEQHSRSWEQALQCPSMRALKTLFNGRKPSEIPIWIYNHLDRNILSVLMDNNARKSREEEDEIEYFKTDFIPEPEPEVKAEKKAQRKKATSDLSVVLPTKRKERADKGKPRKKKEPIGTVIATRLNEFASQVLEEQSPTIKKRGRPKGSKNKVKK